MKLTETDALIDELSFIYDIAEDEDNPYNIGVMAAITTVRRMPTIDAVPVVRCKDCKWGKEKAGNIECNVDMNVPPEYHAYEWFCPNGERREE